MNYSNQYIQQKHFSQDRYLSQPENILNDHSTLQTDQSTSQETLLLQKLQFIKESHEHILEKYKRAAIHIKFLEKENEQLSGAFIGQKLKIEQERLHNLNFQSRNVNLKHDLKTMTTRCKLIQNSFIKEKIENENNKVLYKNILKKKFNTNLMKIDSDTSMSLNSEIENNPNNKEWFHQFVPTQLDPQRDDIITQYLLQKQMKQLRKNNKEIQKLQHSMHMSRRYSSDLPSSSQLE